MDVVCVGAEVRMRESLYDRVSVLFDVYVYIIFGLIGFVVGPCLCLSKFMYCVDVYMRLHVLACCHMVVLRQCATVAMWVLTAFRV